MELKDRDIQILKHIVRYCDEIATTMDRLISVRGQKNLPDKCFICLSGRFFIRQRYRKRVNDYFHL